MSLLRSPNSGRATNREEKVRRDLLRRAAARGLAELVPSVLVVSQRQTEIKAGQRCTVEKKVYPGYVLIAIETTDEGAIPAEVWHLIRETPRRVKLVDTPLSPDEVAKLFQQLEAASRVEAPAAIDFEKGERVRVREGSFVGFEGTIDEVHPEKGIVKVTVLVFGRPTPIDFEYWKVEKVE